MLNLQSWKKKDSIFILLKVYPRSRSHPAWYFFGLSRNGCPCLASVHSTDEDKFIRGKFRGINLINVVQSIARGHWSWFIQLDWLHLGPQILRRFYPDQLQLGGRKRLWLWGLWAGHWQEPWCVDEPNYWNDNKEYCVSIDTIESGVIFYKILQFQQISRAAMTWTATSTRFMLHP